MLANGRLALAATDEPALGARDVLVRVRAVSVNRGELHRLQARQAGWRPGWDFAGEVLECGSATAGHAVGDRVFGTVPGGAWAERVAAPANHVARLPDTLTWAQGAALPVAGVTAMRVLAMAARPLPSQRHGEISTEVGLLHAAGLSRLDALRAATSAAADALALAGEAGRLRPGLRGDVVAVSGNPLEDLGVLRSPTLVIKSGAIAHDSRAPQ